MCRVKYVWIAVFGMAVSGTAGAQGIVPQNKKEFYSLANHPELWCPVEVGTRSGVLTLTVKCPDKTEIAWRSRARMNQLG
jgi:hypothetical protein